MRIFSPIDWQDWKGLSVPGGCPFIHRIWDCLGIRCAGTKISLQHTQWHHSSHQVSGFQRVTVWQHIWRGGHFGTQSSAQDLTKFWMPELGTQGRFPDFPTIFWDNCMHCFFMDCGTSECSGGWQGPVYFVSLGSLWHWNRLQTPQSLHTEKSLLCYGE